MKLLFWGDSPSVTTGFATISKNVCRELDALGWDIEILGVNYRGDPHNEPYQIYPAGAYGDQLGINRINTIVSWSKPDIILFNNDWGNVARLLASPPGVPFVAYMPVDGENLDKAAMRDLSRLTLAIWYTRFGMEQAEKKGFCGRSTIIPHGVDLDFYKPIPKDEARKSFWRSVHPEMENAFIFGNVNRNTPRKRIDISIKMFADWWNAYNRPDDAYLYLHCCDKDKEPSGIDIGKYANYLGVLDRIRQTSMQGFDTFNGIPERVMPYLYNSFDCQITTTIGEGWGLSQLEGMACGIPQIVPEWAALKEWPDDEAVSKIPCHDQIVAQNGVVYATPDRTQFIEAMNQRYTDWKAGTPKTTNRDNLEKYRWKSIGRMFHESLRRAIASFVPPTLQEEPCLPLVDKS